MKHTAILGIVLLAGISLNGCTESLDPLAPGSTDGEFAIGMKTLVPMRIGYHWTYNVSLYDTAGVESMRYAYTLTAVDTVLADTSKIPLSDAEKQSLRQIALVWYFFEGDMGATTCWQVDSLENLCIRSSDDAQFLEQTLFDFRASVGDTTPARATSADINIWGYVDNAIPNDSVRTVLVSKGIDSLRTTLGSAQYYQYRQFYAKRTHFTDYYFKPGFGVLMIERFDRKPDGSVVPVRRDRLVSYYLR